MTAKKSGLGRGLDALFTDNFVEESSATGGAVTLRISDIEPNKAQPRKTFDEEALAELAESIAEHGVLQPLLVRPLTDGLYQIVAGERRWRASRIAGLTEVPVIIRDLSESEAMEIALIENLQREDLNPIEEAEGIQLLIETYGITQETAAARLGKSRSAIANSLRLLTLPENVKELAREGKISSGHARALLSFENNDKINEIAQEITKNDLSVRELERMAKSAKKGDFTPEKRIRKRDTFFDEVEIALTESLGRPVKVFLGKNKGTLEIEFYGKDDLEKLATIFDWEN